MRTAIITSAVLHTGVVLAAWLGLPLHRPDPLIDEQPVFVEIVDVDEMRNAPPMPVQPTPKEEAKPEPPKETPKEVKAEPPKPAPPKPEPPKPSPPQQDIAALPPKPEPEPEPLPKAEPEPAPEPEPEKVEKPEPEKKPEPPKPQLAQVKVPKKPERPQKKADKKPAFDTASVLKTLEKIKQAPQPKPKPDDTAEKKKPDAPKDDTMARIRAALQNNSNSIKYDPTKKVSQLEIDKWRTMIRNQVSKCWSPPYGAPGAEKLKVELNLTVNPDGMVNEVAIADGARMFSDRYFQVAAEAARRAVKDPRCNKFDLPPDKYHVWRDLKFVFDPSGML